MFGKLFYQYIFHFKNFAHTQTACISAGLCASKEFNNILTKYSLHYYRNFVVVLIWNSIIFGEKYISLQQRTSLNPLLWSLIRVLCHDHHTLFQQFLHSDSSFLFGKMYHFFVKKRNNEISLIKNNHWNVSFRTHTFRAFSAMGIHGIISPCMVVCSKKNNNFSMISMWMGNFLFFFEKSSTCNSLTNSNNYFQALSVGSSSTYWVL